MVLALFAPLTSGIQDARAVSSNIVISEVVTGSSTAASDEYVEIFNLSGSPIDLNGWFLKYQGGAAGSGTWSNIFVWSTSTLIPAFGHCLIAGSAYTGSKDGSLSSGISEIGAASIWNGTTQIDTLGWGAMTGHFERAEGNVPVASTGLTRGKVIERKLGYPDWNGEDTDNNVNDFTVSTTSDGSARHPQTLTSPITPPPSYASVSTSDATNVTGTSASLNGNLTSMGNDTAATVHFEYGLDTSYGTATADQILTAVGAFSANLTALTSGQTYHFRAVATNTYGTVYGSDKTFATTGPQVVVTSPANGATGVDGAAEVTATFDREMDGTTITDSTFLVKDAASNPVTGTVSYASKVATFTPTSLLADSTTYTATLTTGIKDAMGAGLDASYSWSFTTGPITIAAARALPLGTSVYVQGNVTVVPGTYNRGFAIQDTTGGVYIFPGSQPTGISLGDVVKVKGVLTNYSNLLEIVPASLSNINAVSSGTCPAPTDLTVSQVGESYEGLLVRVPGTVTSKSGTTAITINITDGAKTVQVYVYASTGIKTSGINVGDTLTATGFLGQYSSNYQIQPRYQSDIVLNKPQVVSTNPAGGAAGVSPSTTISATFDRALDASTVTTSTFTVKDSENNLIAGSVVYDNSTYTVTFTPSSPLPLDTFTPTLSGSIKDTDGKLMGSDYTWSFATLTFELPCPTSPFTQSTDSSLKIFAVMYNSLEPGMNEKGEALCLTNTGSTTDNISNYVITDFEGSVKLPSGTTLAPNAKIWIAREATEFQNEFNFKPAFEYGADTDLSVPNLAQVDVAGITQVSGTYPILDNTGDECAVFDASTSAVDVVAWGTSNYANTGWTGPKINPYIFASYISPEGDIACRKLDETTGTPIADTNTTSDWSWDPSDPIDGCKIMYPGWDTWESSLFFPVKDTATVQTTFFADPDNGFAATTDFIASATTSIKIELYEITELEVMNEVLARMDAGVKVTVLMDGNLVESNGALYSQVSWFAQQVYNKGGTVYFLRNGSSVYTHDRYNNVHIKTIIVDDARVLITSDNFTRSSMPCDDFSNGTLGERGTGVITDDPAIVQGVLGIFNHDFQPGYYDVSPYDPVKDAPPVGYAPPAMSDQTGYMPVLPNPLTVHETEYLELIDSSDTSMRSVDSVIGLLNKAGAGDLIIDEAQYEYLYWGPTGSQYINPRLQAMIAAANRGAQVYLLLDSYNSSSTNNPTKSYLDGLHIATLHCLLGAPTGLAIHNKLFVERIGGLGYVNISSINGSENASRANRELGLIVQSNAGFEYYYQMFSADWAVSGGASLSSNPGTVYSICSAGTTGGTITPSGTVQVMNGESQTFAMKPDFGYFIYKVLVDGVAIKVADQVGMSPTMTYTFGDVTSNHTISAEFVKLPDTTPPTLTLPTVDGINLDAPGSAITINSDAFTFTVAATDDTGIGRLLVKVNGQPQIDKSDLDPTIFLSEGTNSVEVIVYDRAGNYASKSFSIISDTKPPVVTLGDVPKTVTKKALVLRGTVVDQTTGLRSFTINGNQIITTLTGEFETTVALNQGANAITVDALDRVGNRFTQTYTISYTQPQVRQSYMLVLTVGSPIITVNGLSKKIDAQGSTPVIKNSRTLLPIRTLIESLGGTVSWNSSEQKVTVNLHGHSMALWIGKTTALVDGSKVSLDVAPMILGGRTYLPLRFISEHLGASVDWDADSRTITIYYWE